MQRIGKPGRSLLHVVGVVAVAIAVASNAGVALASASLPDARGYELASPASKNGGDVMARGTRTRVGADGSKVQFTSLSAFGDVLGTGLATDYMSVRTATPGTSGWSTHSLFPKVDPLSLNAGIADFDTYYQGELSSDLSTGVLRAFTSLTPNDPNVAQVPNLYLRRDLLSPGSGTYDLLTPCPVCVTPLNLMTVATARPFVADATPDFGHVIFETRFNLLPGVGGGQPKLYEWDHGTLYLAGVLPDGSVPSRSTAGAGALSTNNTPNTISDDGSKIFFASGGSLYMRTDHTTTTQIDASEQAGCVAAPGSCPAASSTYGKASSDGSKVIFTSTDQLTDTPGSGLYMYDATLPDSDPHNLTLLSPDTDNANAATTVNVLGTSEDDSYAYFTANDQLISGQPDTGGHDGIYVWHAGTLTYIGTLMDGGDAENNAIPFNWGLLPQTARVTPDGKHLLFTSHLGEGLTGYDHGTGCLTGSIGSCTELYLYDAPTDLLRCVSCNPSGAPATADAGFNLEIGIGGSRATAHQVHPISNDGRYVFFTTGERLVPEDRNGKVRDAYEYDATTGKLHLLSSGQSPSDSYFLDASPDGKNVFIATRERLVGWDVDGGYDLYDVRVGGGFPEPRAAEPECTGDVCQGTPNAGPGSLGTLATRRLHDHGNVTRSAHRHRKKCAHGKVRKRVHGKVKCVKRDKHAKRAGTSRRGK